MLVEDNQYLCKVIARESWSNFGLQEYNDEKLSGLILE